MATIVVQFGLATMPLGIEARACSLASGTTRGTSGSMRHADELSMTVAPAAATRSARARDAVAPAENRAMSRPSYEAVSASSTTRSVPFQAIVRPAERAEANSRSSSTGKSRSSRMVSMTPPT